MPTYIETIVVAGAGMKRIWNYGAELGTLVFVAAGLGGAYFVAIQYPYGNFLYNYQTLITGIITVAAAFLTIRRMGLSDEKQDARHNELVRMQVRRDQNALERIANLYLYVGAIIDPLDDGDWNERNMEGSLHFLKDQALEVNQLRDGNDAAVLEELLPLDLALQRKRLLENVEKIRVAVVEFSNGYVNLLIPAEHGFETARASSFALEFITEVKENVEAVDNFVREFSSQHR